MSLTAPTIQRITLTLLSILGAVCLCLALYCFTVSTKSFADLQTIVLSSVPPGYADRFTQPLYQKLIITARIGALVLLLLAVGALVFRRALQKLAIQIASEQFRLLQFFRPWFSLARNSKLYNCCFLSILLLGFLLRLYFLSEPLRKDETNSYLYYANHPIILGITYYTANNHLLNTLLMHISTAALGGSSWAIRLPTFIAGCLILLLTYFVALLWHGRTCALLAVSLVSVSSPLIEYSFNARGYSLGTLFFLLMVILVKPASKGLIGAWLCLSLCAALALYSVPTMLYGVVAVYGYLLWRSWRRYLIYFLGSALTGVMLFLLLLAPALLTVGPDAVIHNKWVLSLPRTAWPMAILNETRSLARYWTTDVPWFAVAVFVVAILWTVAQRRARLFPPVALIVILGFILCVALPLQSIVPPRRTYLYALPLFCVAIAAGLSALIRMLRGKGTAGIALALVMTLGLGGRVFAFRSLEHSGLESAGCRDAAQIAHSFSANLQNGDQFICGEGCDSPLDFFIQRDGIRYHPLPGGALLIVVDKRKDPAQFINELGLSNQVHGYTRLADFEDVAVYRATRGAGLPFKPGGDAYMGAFTSYKE